ncbi:hypothetical protein [Amycolatopsis suaedae]|uniref:Uncharacterized protein n=1 Tax=Amycolatopsis suaedae TaxID=2510978 RepID=A0A4Q7JF62_9PSEU|nr:hypothetical protein [Amycolatopsis suaedae]RZQ65812.1 hypothetical protein EWH70_01640 [Amycolatopsis suaedae]
MKAALPYRLTACVAVVVAVLAGALLVSLPAHGGPVTEPRVATCDLPGGPVEVPAELTAVFPDEAAGHFTAQLRVTLTLPAPAMDTLRPGATVAADVRVAVRQGGSTQDVAATGLSTTDIRQPDVTLTGELPAVPIRPGSEAVVELTGLTPVLPAGPCTADAPRRELARIAAKPEPRVQACPGAVCTSLKVEGTSRVAKLGSDIVLEPGRFEAVAYFDGPEPGWPLRLEGELNLPPVDAYFVVFRFMPSTSRVAFLPRGKATGKGRIVTPPGVQCNGLCVEVDMIIKLDIKLSDVEQDGVPLRVGDRCATATPAEIPMRGVIAGIGGPPGTKSEFRARYAIPSYGGCGTAENLDRLFTGLVSGPGNELHSILTTLPPGAP